MVVAEGLQTLEKGTKRKLTKRELKEPAKRNEESPLMLMPKRRGTRRGRGTTRLQKQKRFDGVERESPNPHGPVQLKYVAVYIS